MALNTHATPTAACVSDPDWQFPAGAHHRERGPCGGDDRIAADHQVGLGGADLRREDRLGPVGDLDVAPGGAAFLRQAAHLEGKGIVTQDSAGLAQKGGATWSHVQIANRPEAIFSTKVGTAEADLVIGCDPIVTASKATLATIREGRTYVAVNTHAT